MLCISWIIKCLIKSKELNINVHMKLKPLHVLVRQIITFPLRKHWYS